MSESPTTATQFDQAIAILADLVAEAYHRDPAGQHLRARRKRESDIHAVMEAVTTEAETNRTDRRQLATIHRCSTASVAQIR